MAVKVIDVRKLDESFCYVVFFSLEARIVRLDDFSSQSPPITSGLKIV